MSTSSLRARIARLEARIQDAQQDLHRKPGSLEQPLLTRPDEAPPDEADTLLLRRLASLQQLLTAAKAQVARMERDERAAHAERAERRGNT